MAKKKGKQVKPVTYSLPNVEDRLDATLSIRLSEALKNKLQDYCEKNGFKTNSIVNHIIKEFLDSQGA